MGPGCWSDVRAIEGTLVQRRELLGLLPHMWLRLPVWMRMMS